jgi:hypothetical protein
MKTEEIKSTKRELIKETEEKSKQSIQAGKNKKE